MAIVPMIISEEDGALKWESSKNLRVDQLRSELSRLGLDVTGSKVEMVDQIQRYHTEMAERYNSRLAEIFSSLRAQTTDNEDMQDLLYLLNKLQSYYRDVIKNYQDIINHVHHQLHPWVHPNERETDDPEDDAGEFR